MRKFLIGAPLALAMAAVLASPAAAQHNGHQDRPGNQSGRYGDNAGELRSEIAKLDRQVDRAQSRHMISDREAKRLDGQVNALERLHAQYARGGFTRAELQTLNQRINAVERIVAREINDRDGRRG